MEKYNVIACGGTFEYLHDGHKAFLRFAFSHGKKVLIGLTSDLFIKRNEKGTRLPFVKRRKTLEAFLEKDKFQNQTEILPIDDIYIPKSWESLQIDAIVVTKDSLWGAKDINKKRKQNGLAQLKILIAPILMGKDGRPISSSTIRAFTPFTTLLLPDDIRAQLKKPLGILISDFDAWVFKQRENLSPSSIITVGDVITKTCNALALQQRLSIIDFYVEREKKFSDIKDLGFNGKEKIINVVNKAGTLTPLLFAKIEDIIYAKLNKRQVLLVDGEEDLAVLPCMLFAPIGHTIFYGQPHQGVVQVTVSKETKIQARNIISQFI